MALAHDLLTQAALLALMDKGKPKQANLRRSVSTAYYALFHLLVDHGASAIGCKLTAAGKAKVRRAFMHADMKAVCAQYAKATLSSSMHTQIAPLLTFPLAESLKSVAEAFVQLQEARHLADYDLSTRFSRVEVVALIRVATNAFSDWKNTMPTANANVFLVDLLLRKSWARA